MTRNFLVIFLSWLIVGFIASPANSFKIKAAYNSLDPFSIPQHLAFYELYPQEEIGKQALNRAWRLMSGNFIGPMPVSNSALNEAVCSIISLINKDPTLKVSEVNEEATLAIEKAAFKLENRKLKGYYAKSEEEILALEPKEIDLARAIFLSQQQYDSEAFHKQRNYEAAIDLMALQIAARFLPNTTVEQKIRLINDFVFFDLGFRFPPHSLYELAVDRYTFLSSVIDSRRGICLGVSVLYLSLAQRLGVPLEIVTPPGHIFVRYRNGDQVINIETTARGIHIDSEEYLTLDTLALQERDLKETVGFVYFNQAADALREGNFAKAIEAYQKAGLYISDDPLLLELSGICFTLTGNLDKGTELMQKSLAHPCKFRIGKNANCEDFLEEAVDAEALKTLFMHTDEKRESILSKQKVLQEQLQRFPKFRAGLFALAMSWVQLHRLGEALEILQRYHAIDSSDPQVEFYLAAIYAERFNMPKAWEHLKNAEAITSARGHFPKALREFRRELLRHSPE